MDYDTMTEAHVPTGDRFGIKPLETQGKGMGEILGAVESGPHAGRHQRVTAKPEPKAKASTSKGKASADKDKGQGQPLSASQKAAVDAGMDEDEVGGY